MATTKVTNNTTTASSNTSMSMMDQTQWPLSSSFASSSTTMEDSMSEGSSRNSLELYGDEYSNNLIDTTNNTVNNNLDHAFGPDPGESSLFLQSFLTEMSSSSTGTGSPSPSGFYHSSSTGASSPSFSAFYNSSSPGSTPPFTSNPFASSPFPHFGQNSGEAYAFQDCPGGDGCDAFQLEISGGNSSTSFQPLPSSSSSPSLSSDPSAFPSSLPPPPPISEFAEMSDVTQGYQEDQIFEGEITSVEEVDQLIASLTRPHFNPPPVQSFASNTSHSYFLVSDDQAPARKRPRSSLEEEQVANTQYSMLPTTFHPHPHPHSHSHSRSHSQSSLSIACPPSQSQLQTQAQTQPQAFDMMGNPIQSHRRTPSYSSSSSSTPSPSSSTPSPSSSNGMMVQVKTSSPPFGSLSPILTTPTGSQSPQTAISQGGQPRLAPAPVANGNGLTAEEKEDAMLSSVGLNRQQLLHMTSREFDTYRKKLEASQDLSEEQKVLLQYQRRTIKNREYAQTSRQKKKNLLSILESRVQVLESENSSLSSQNAQLQSKLIQLANSFRSFSAESMRSHRLLSDRLAILDPHFSPSSQPLRPAISAQGPPSLVKTPSTSDRPRDRISLPGSNKKTGFNNNNISVLVIVLSVGVLFSSSFFPSLSSSPSSSLSPSGGSSRVIMSEDQGEPTSLLHNLLWVFEWRTIERPLNWLYEMFIPHTHKHLVLDDPLDSVQLDYPPSPSPSPLPLPSAAQKAVVGLSPLPQDAVDLSGDSEDLLKDRDLDLLQPTDAL